MAQQAGARKKDIPAPLPAELASTVPRRQLAGKKMPVTSTATVEGKHEKAQLSPLDAREKKVPEQPKFTVVAALREALREKEARDRAIPVVGLDAFVKAGFFWTAAGKIAPQVIAGAGIGGGLAALEGKGPTGILTGAGLGALGGAAWRKWAPPGVGELSALAARRAQRATRLREVHLRHRLTPEESLARLKGLGPKIAARLRSWSAVP